MHLACKELRLLIESQLPVGVETYQTDEEALNRRIEHIATLFNVQAAAKQTIREAQAKQKTNFDAARATPKYKVGDRVLLNNARRSTRKGVKLFTHWSTKPYAAEEVMAKVYFVSREESS